VLGATAFGWGAYATVRRIRSWYGLSNASRRRVVLADLAVCLGTAATMSCPYVLVARGIERQMNESAGRREWSVSLPSFVRTQGVPVPAGQLLVVAWTHSNGVSIAAYGPDLPNTVWQREMPSDAMLTYRTMNGGQLLVEANLGNERGKALTLLRSLTGEKLWEHPPAPYDAIQTGSRGFVFHVPSGGWLVYDTLEGWVPAPEEGANGLKLLANADTLALLAENRLYIRRIGKWEKVSLPADEMSRSVQPHLCWVTSNATAVLLQDRAAWFDRTTGTEIRSLPLALFGADPNAIRPPQRCDYRSDEIARHVGSWIVLTRTRRLGDGRLSHRAMCIEDDGIRVLWNERVTDRLLTDSVCGLFPGMATDGKRLVVMVPTGTVRNLLSPEREVTELAEYVLLDIATGKHIRRFPASRMGVGDAQGLSATIVGSNLLTGFKLQFVEASDLITGSRRSQFWFVEMREGGSMKRSAEASARTAFEPLPLFVGSRCVWLDKSGRVCCARMPW